MKSQRYLDILAGVLEGGQLGTRARVEPIAPGIAEKIEGQDSEQYRQSRKDHHVRRVE